MISALAVGSILEFNHLGFSHSSFVYLFIFAAFIPYVFALTHSWKVDRFLADMSFPLYLAHWPVWLFIRDYLPVPWPQYPGIVPALASIAAAAGLVVFVERPIERWRHNRTESIANPATSWKPADPLVAATIAPTE